MTNPMYDLQQLIEREYSGNQSKAAAGLGISEALLSMILHMHREIPDSVLRILGYEWQIVRVNPMEHPKDAMGFPSLVERKLTKAPTCLDCEGREDCYTRITRGVPPDYGCFVPKEGQK